MKKMTYLFLLAATLGALSKAGRWLEDNPLIQVIFQPLSYSPPTHYAISGRYYSIQILRNGNASIVHHTTPIT